MACTTIHYLRDGGPVPRPRERNAPFVNGADGNVVTFDDLSAVFCVAGDSIGDAFVRS